jgi:hypothetical protein
VTDPAVRTVLKMTAHSTHPADILYEYKLLNSDLTAHRRQQAPSGSSLRGSVPRRVCVTSPTPDLTAHRRQQAPSGSSLRGSVPRRVCVTSPTPLQTLSVLSAASYTLLIFSCATLRYTFKISRSNSCNIKIDRYNT